MPHALETRKCRANVGKLDKRTKTNENPGAGKPIPGYSRVIPGSFPGHSRVESPFVRGGTPFRIPGIPGYPRVIPGSVLGMLEFCVLECWFYAEKKSEVVRIRN